MFLFFGLFFVFQIFNCSVMKQHDVLQLNNMLYILKLLFIIFVFYVFYFELFCNSTCYMLYLFVQLTCVIVMFLVISRCSHL